MELLTSSSLACVSVCGWDGRTRMGGALLSRLGGRAAIYYQDGHTSSPGPWCRAAFDNKTCPLTLAPSLTFLD